MNRSTRPACVLSVLMVTATFLLTLSATAQRSAPPKMTVTLTNSSITVNPKSPKGGNYLITVKNNSAVTKGLQIYGKDKNGTPFVRFSNMLIKGDTEDFKFLIPSGRRIVFRDVIRCGKAENTCMNPEFGQLKVIIIVR